ncbi:MAG: TraR/DksA C4-type zinc finger protein [Pseudomonadota bacterium]
MKHDDIMRSLAKLRAEILDDADTNKDAAKPVTLDQQAVGRVSRIDAIQRQQMAVAVAARRKTMLIQIEQACERLQTGDYGYCVICDGAIGDKRLTLNPIVTTCIDCAK